MPTSKGSELFLLERRIFRLFRKGLTNYNLIENGDRILVGLSGGKDSLALVDFLGKQAKIHNPNFTVEALHVRMQNIDYQSDIRLLQDFAEKAGVTLHVRETGFEPDQQKHRSPCFLCSWNRRKILFETAQELNFNKIALGHHMDDILHTLLMNQFFEGQFSTMPVKLKMRKFPLTIIRPLCKVQEKDLLSWAKYKQYPTMIKRCPYENISKRTEIRTLFEQLEQMNPEIRYSLWNAMEKENKLAE